jgi:hypothetical protein
MTQPLAAQHEFDPWPDRVAFYYDGEPVVQRCLDCRQPYSDPAHLPMVRAEESAPVITDGPWKGWRQAGWTEDNEYATWPAYRWALRGRELAEMVEVIAARLDESADGDAGAYAADLRRVLAGEYDPRSEASA